MSILYSPGRIGTLELKNRWIMLAMHLGYADEKGNFSERDMAFYGRRASGGMAAITLCGAVAVIGAQAGMHLLDNPGIESSLREVTDIIHNGNTKVIMHLFHAGRNNRTAVNGLKPVSASDVPSPIYREVPEIMTGEMIADTIRKFAEASVRCRDCGVDAVEVSVSAGYLLTQFMSPRTNLRTDEWGGTEAKRLRFPQEVLKAIRRAVGPDYPVIIKVSGGDMLGGYDNDLNIRLINSLPKGTIDGVTVTGGWHEAPVPQMTYQVSPGHFAYLAKEIRLATGLPVTACNRINDSTAAERLLEEGFCDFTGAARPFLADPDFAKKERQEIPYRKCLACNKGCIERVLKDKDAMCAINPHAGREYLEKDITGNDNQNILVVGGGPVGMEAALLLSEEGHRVTLICKEDFLGGKLAIASRPPHKEGLLSLREDLRYEMMKSHVDVRTGTDLTESILMEIRPQKVYFATGSLPIEPEIQNDGSSKVVSFEEILLDKDLNPGDHVVVVGGGSVGLETAEYLNERFPETSIEIIEMAAKAGKDLGGIKWIIMKELKERGITVHTLCKLTAIKNGMALCETLSDSESKIQVSIPCDTAVLAIGSRPQHPVDFENTLDSLGIPYCVVGDADGKGDIFSGFKDCYSKVKGISF